VKAQEPQPEGPAGRRKSAGRTSGETAGGGIGVVTRRYLPGEESSEGVIPGALPVRNRAGAGSKGVSRQEGGQTLKAERSGQVKPAASGPSVPDVL